LIKVVGGLCATSQQYKGNWREFGLLRPIHAYAGFNSTPIYGLASADLPQWEVLSAPPEVGLGIELLGRTFSGFGLNFAIILSSELLGRGKTKLFIPLTALLPSLLINWICASA